MLFGNAIEVEEQYGSLDALFASKDEDLLADLTLDIEPEKHELPTNTDPLQALDNLMGAAAVRPPYWMILKVSSRYPPSLASCHKIT